MKIGLLGVGTVGAALVGLLAERDHGLQVAKALVREPARARLGLAAAQLSDDPQAVLAAGEVVVEVMGGVGLAGDLMLQALAEGKRVVTANKAALAERWDEFAPFLYAGLVYCEAAVMAGTPVIGALTGALRGSRPLELHAVLNGTCAYILEALEAGSSYHEALAAAQRLGYAEADPTLDVGGFDAAHKLTVLARLAFDPALRWDEVRAATEGITGLTPARLAAARAEGRRVRLVGSIYPEGGRWAALVRPVRLPESHPLAAGPGNALVYRGDPLGEVLVRGAGAGGPETASGVLGDLLAVLEGRPGPRPLAAAAPVPAHPAQALKALS